MRSISLFLSAWLLVCSIGCADFAAFRKKQVANRADNIHEERMEQLWRSGVGFNNPNSDRRRAGLQPVSFSGRTEREESHNFFERLVGDAIGFVFVTGAQAVGRAIFDRSPKEDSSVIAADLDPNAHRIADEEFQPPNPISIASQTGEGDD